MDYFIHLAILICIYLILTQSFNVCFGLGHLFNLAHVAIYAIGAYTTALLSTELDVGFIRCIIASFCFSGLFAILVGGISLKLKQDYFAIGTIAFSSVISALLINWKSLTRGVLGIPAIPRPELFNIDFYQNINFLILVTILAVLVNVILFFFFRNFYSRSLKAQAEFEQAAQSLGIHTTLVRNISFFIAAAFGGVSGSLFAYYINYIDPSSFSLTEMIFVLTIAVVGRPGSFWGCIVAVIFLVLLPEPLRFIDLSPSILGPMRQLLYAVILFSVVFINRKNLFPVVREV